jgi:hypothetical protein
VVEFEFGDLDEQISRRFVRYAGLLGKGLTVDDALSVKQEEHVVASPAQSSLVEMLAAE